MENKPRISKWIGGCYLLLFVFVAAIFISIAIWADVFSVMWAGILFAVVMIAALVLIGVVAYSLYKTVYVIRDGYLYSWSPFTVINLRLKDITTVEKARIPFYFKGWGASVYSGFFYIPAFGWTRVVMTNMTDGVLITDRNGKRYLITPSDPAGFIKSLNIRP